MRLQRTVDRIAGAAQLQVTRRRGRVSRGGPRTGPGDTRGAGGGACHRGACRDTLPGQGNVLILGVDMTGDRSLREYDLESGDAAVVDDPLVFLAQPDSIIITSEFATRNGLKVGDRFFLSTIAGDKAFTVRGVMRSGGLTSAFGGNLAVMDIYAAQQVFGRGRQFDRIDLKLQEGIPVDSGRAAVQRRSAPDSTFSPPRRADNSSSRRSPCMPFR